MMRGRMDTNVAASSARPDLAGDGKAGTAGVILVRFSYQERDDVISLTLPAGTLFEELDQILCSRGYLFPQQPGYYYLVKDHLCGRLQRLSDYLPAGAGEMDVRVFGIPQIMV